MTPDLRPCLGALFTPNLNHVDAAVHRIDHILAKETATNNDEASSRTADDHQKPCRLRTATTAPSNLVDSVGLQAPGHRLRIWLGKPSDLRGTRPRLDTVSQTGSRPGRLRIQSVHAPA